MWAVGSYKSTTSAVDQALIEHWDGTAWSVVPGPSTGTSSALSGVVAIAGGDVWAVGHYYDMDTLWLTLIEHWDGTAWSVIPSPNMGSQNNVLWAVAAGSATDVWAVGNYDDGIETLPLMEHWDGTVWSIATSPDTDTFQNYLYGVAVISPSDAWAVGGDRGTGETLSLHWDGTVWSVVPSPNPASFENNFTGIWAVSSTDVWAVGDYNDAGASQTLTAHWDGTTWSVVPSPNVGEFDSNYLTGVSAMGANDVWSVGYSTPLFGYRTLIEHWDGSAWAVASSPNNGVDDNILRAIAVISGGNGAAVGDFVNGGVTHTLALAYHVSCLTATPTPSRIIDTMTPVYTATPTLPPCVPQWQPVPRPGVNPVWDISAPAYDDAWAVSQDGTLHWDGEAWSQVDPGQYDSVSAHPAGNIWAVNYSSVVRWNGTGWTNVPVPSPTPIDWTYDFVAVAAASADDVWVVGGQAAPTKGPRPYLVLHFTGETWQEVPAGESGLQEPNRVDAQPDGAYIPPSEILMDVAIQGPNDMVAVGYHVPQDSFDPDKPIAVGVCSAEPCPTPIAPDTGSAFYGVAAAGTDDVWAVGRNRDYHSLIEHWDGVGWSVVDAPNVSTLTSAVAIAPNDVWAVGSGGTLHWDGTAWSVVPSPTVALSVDASSANDVWAVGNQDILHYPSTRAFTDVLPADTFYLYVQAMSCRGIISGYPCGGPGEPCDPSTRPYFRPANQVTRGQIAKIVAIAAGFTEPAGGQTFEDVLPGSTFYDYVERLAVRNVMQGYPCGGPGEPCVEPDNRPYFRPNATATRGQLTKIVSNAAGFQDPIPAGQYTFADMLPDSTYWLYVERLLVERPGVMSGYPCGGVGEPCDAQNRPYFRPANNVTRGQASKIVSNSFFPTYRTSASVTSP
jgi:hypothetical protein